MLRVAVGGRGIVAGGRASRRGRETPWKADHAGASQHSVAKTSEQGWLAAIWTGLSRRSYWHLSKSLAARTGMTNQWLAEQGLLSIRDLWLKAQGYA